MKIFAIIVIVVPAISTSEVTDKRDASAEAFHEPLSPLGPYPPVPRYPSPAPHYPAPQGYGAPPYIEVEETQHHYGHHPSHNCTVLDEVLTAEICTPTYAPACGPMPVKGTRLGEREECRQVTRTVCTQGQVVEQAEICLIEYIEEKQAVAATTVEVKFEKQCEKQMVTVCQPQPSYGPSYHSVQHCKEVGQETCYNLPSLEPRPVQVEISLPQPKQRCENRPVVLPIIECEDLQETRCVMLPTVEPFDTEATACVPVVAKPKCDKVELVLPKQVCRELLYGFAEKPIQPHYQHLEEHPPPPPPVPHIPYNANTRKIKYLGTTERASPRSDDHPLLNGTGEDIELDSYTGDVESNEA